MAGQHKGQAAQREGDEGDRDISISFNGLSSTSDIIEYFSQDSDVISRYEDSRNWYYFLNGKPFLGLVAAYFVGLLASLVLDYFSIFSEGTRENLIGGGFLILLTIPILIWIIKKIVQNRVKKEGLSAEDAIYYELSTAIENYDEKRYSDTLDNLKNAKVLLSKGSPTPFDSRFTEDLRKYLEIVEEEGSEKFVEKSFHKIKNYIVSYLYLIKESQTDELYPADKPSEIDYSSPIGMIRSYIYDISDNPIIRVSIPVILGLPVVAFIYIFVDESVGNYSFFAYIAIVQIYYNVRGSE